MLLTLFTTHQPATDLGYLLHKHPERVQSFDLSFGQAHLFYPRVSAEGCEACLLLEVDPIGMVRRQREQAPYLLKQYVNDRSYVASSYLSVAISQVLGSALAGRCKERPELVETAIPLCAKIDVLPVRGGVDFLQRVFEPLGYEVEAVGQPLDPRFLEWGESPYYSVTIRGTKRLSELLSHLYVLVPVFDNEKHYYIGEDELEKLLTKGAGWLASHPEKTLITRRYLGNRLSLFRQAIARLVEEEPEPADAVTTANEEKLEQPLSLNDQRYAAVLAALRASGAKSVVDLGCGEGKLLRELLQEKQLERIVGLDVSIRALEIANRRLKIDRLPEFQAKRLQLLHGSLMYRDPRIAGFDAAAVVEVIEHLDPPRLSAMERTLFEYAKPTTVVLTTPNQEYNAMWETLPAGEFRHHDHRFEWTRAQFRAWGERVAEKFGYQVQFLPVGPVDAQVGAPTQLALFEREQSEDAD